MCVESPKAGFLEMPFNDAQLEAIRSGEWKLVLPRLAGELTPWYEQDHHHIGGKAFETRGYEEVKEYELYNLEKDIGEQHDIADKHPDIVDKLKQSEQKALIDLGTYNRIGKGVRFYDDGEKWPNRKEWMGST